MASTDDVIERLATIELEDTDGKINRLESYWRDQTIVLAFVRHFG
ncbi:MAG: hypothetical protein QF570_11210 [Myxococcota bacterium]|jgi:hypothetical protein|nr:hypothetical protein [Myxococcota bacterium]